MSLKNKIKYISAPSKTIMTLIVLLAIILLIQITVYIENERLVIRRYAKKLTKAKAEPAQPERIERKIAKANKPFLSDGTIHFIYDNTTQRRRTDQLISVYDANDTLLWEGKKQEQPYEYIKWCEFFYYSYASNKSKGIDIEDMEQMEEINDWFTDTLIIPVVTPGLKTEDTEIIERWHYQPGRRFFIGYNSEGYKIAYAGSNGFAKLKGQIEPFEEFEFMTGWTGADSLSPVLLWLTKSRLYQIDFSERSVEVLFNRKGMNIKRMAISNWFSGVTDDKGYRPLLYLVLEDGRRHLLFKDPPEQLTFELPAELEAKVVYVAALHDKIFLHTSGIEGFPSVYNNSVENWELRLQWWEQHAGKPIESYTKLYQLSRSGKVVPINHFEYTRTLPPRSELQQEQEAEIERLRGYVMATSPAVFNWIQSFYESYYNLTRYYSLYPSSYLLNRKIIDVVNCFRPRNQQLNWALGIIMVCVAFWHGWPRRTGKGRLIFWLVLVALLNLTGFLTYLALNHTTVIRCAKCGKKRGLERSDCPACGAELPVPERRETDLILVGQSNS